MSERSQHSITAEDMQVAVRTTEFIAEQTEIEEAKQLSPSGHETAYYDDGTHATGWPRERAMIVADRESAREDSDIDTDAFRRVAALQNEADHLNNAYDVVATGGEKGMYGRANPDYEPRPNGIADAGNTSGTRGYSVMPPADNVSPAAGRNIAVVRSALSGATNPGFRNQPAHVFAPHNQERAKELIQALDIKKGQRMVERERAHEVAIAKKALGIAGFKKINSIRKE